MTILALLAAFSALQGFLSIASSTSAMHQIYGATWWIVFAVSVAGFGTMYAIWTATDVLKQNRPDKKE